jgi:hypothetical protein
MQLWLVGWLHLRLLLYFSAFLSWRTEILLLRNECISTRKADLLYAFNDWFEVQFPISETLRNNCFFNYLQQFINEYLIFKFQRSMFYFTPFCCFSSGNYLAIFLILKYLQQKQTFSEQKDRTLFQLVSYPFWVESKFSDIKMSKWSFSVEFINEAQTN